MRHRGFLAVGLVAGTAALTPVGAYGICVVNGEAFDAGVASVPTPWTESFDDRWMYHTYFGSLQQPIAVTDQLCATDYITIDSKSMRKVEIGDVIIQVIESGSADTITFLSNLRTLIKLH